MSIERRIAPLILVPVGVSLVLSAILLPPQFAAAQGASGWWAIDLALPVQAGGRLLAGAPTYADPGFLWSPLAAFLGAPLSLLPFALVACGWALVKLAIVAGVVWRVPGPWQVRLLLAVAVATSLPVVQDIVLGNVMVPLGVAILLVIAGPRRLATGIPLGVMIAITPKPFALPILAWILFQRREAAVGVALGAGVSLGVALLVTCDLGSWLAALSAGMRFATPFTGNIAPPAALLPFMAILTAAVLVALRNRPDAGAVAALACGFLVSPWAGLNALAPLVLLLARHGALLLARAAETPSPSAGAVALRRLRRLAVLP